MDVEWIGTLRGRSWIRAQLLRAGATDRHLAAAVEAGLLLRLRPGWYATGDLDRDTVRRARKNLESADLAAHLHGR